MFNIQIIFPLLTYTLFFSSYIDLSFIVNFLKLQCEGSETYRQSYSYNACKNEIG